MVEGGSQATWPLKGVTTPKKLGKTVLNEACLSKINDTFGGKNLISHDVYMISFPGDTRLSETILLIPSEFQKFL